MQGVVVLGDRELEIQNFADPSPGPEEVVLEHHVPAVFNRPVSRGEVVVPEKRQLLEMRIGRIMHPIQPPSLKITLVACIIGSFAKEGLDGFKFLRFGLRH